jgi:hypothetical protein
MFDARNRNVKLCDLGLPHKGTVQGFEEILFVEVRNMQALR